jgi:phosphohistidine phosphatase
VEVYLARHGEAVAGGADAARPLTARGREEIERVGRHAARLGFRVAEIRHSGLVRARETAAILATHLEPPRGVRETTGLRPDDDPWIAAAECETPDGPLLLVGHLPLLGRLAAALVTGDAEREVVRFRTGTIVRLTGGDRGWLVAALTGPEEA